MEGRNGGGNVFGALVLPDEHRRYRSREIVRYFVCGWYSKAIEVLAEQIHDLGRHSMVSMNQWKEYSLSSGQVLYCHRW